MSYDDLNVNSGSAGNVSNSSSPLPPNLTQPEVDAMNQLWMALEGLRQAEGGPTYPSYNYPQQLMLAQAITKLMNLKLQPSLSDPTSTILFQLSGGSSPPASGSPAALAAAFVSDPTDSNLANMLMSSMSSLNSLDGSLGNGFCSLVNNWWSGEGISSSCHATINPGNLSQQAVQNLVDALNNYMSATTPTDSNDWLAAIMTDIPYVNGQLSGQNLDPFSQVLYQMLNTPMDPNYPNSSLVALATSKNSGELAHYLGDDNFGLTLAAHLGILISKEWEGG